MFCKNCGKQIDDKAVICIHCGVLNSNQISPSIQPEGTFDWLTTLLLCFFLGVLGIHSFYTKKTGVGVAQLLTLGGCGIWALIDFIMILIGSYKDGNGNPLYRKN
jgi:peptidoglycan/LPS O-acetylase OafA/YrhL